MLQGEHSAILSTFIKLQFVLKTFVLSVFECLLRQGLLYIWTHIMLNEIFETAWLYSDVKGAVGNK